MESTGQPDDPDRTPWARPADPDAGVAETAAELLGALTAAAAGRRVVARVDDGEQVIEVASGIAGRWSARTAMVEWSYGPDGLASWHVSLAGAKPRSTTEARGWVHPAVGLLRPDLLPVWGRPGDRYAPVHVTPGAHGPALLDLAPRGGEVVAGLALGRGGVLYVDAARLLVTCLDLGDRCWTLVDYREL